jgi:hypothetical protein
LSTIETPTGIKRLAPWLGLAGVGALWVAADAMAARSLPPAAVACLAGGLLAWAAAAWMDPPAPDSLGNLDPPAGRPRAVPLLLALAAAAFYAWRMPAERFRLDGVLAWLAAIALWCFAWRAARRPKVPERPGDAGRRWLVRGAVVAILAVGAWFNFHDLAGVPANPVSDHAEELQDLLDLVHGQHGTYFFGNLGVPPLPHYWSAAFLGGLGLPVRYLWVKAGTAAFGLLLLPALYAVGAELGGASLGVAAAAFAAWGKWPVSLARQGQGYIHPVPIVAFVLWALLRWMRRGDRGSVLLAGAGVGMGLCAYQSFRIVPLLVPLAVAAALFDRRRRGRRWRSVGGGALVAATSAIVGLPVLKFALVGEHREFFWARVLTRGTDVEQQILGRPLTIFAGNLWNMAKAFHWRGSSTWTVLLPYDPFLDAVSGALLLAGLLLAARYAAGGAWRWTWILPALFVLTLPSTLVFAYPEENPSLNRSGAAIPLVFLLVGLPVAYLWRGFLRERMALLVAGIAALLAAAAVSARENAEAYFGRFAARYDAVIDHAMEMAAVLRGYQAQGIPLDHQYLLAADFWVDARNIAIELGDPAWVTTHNIPAPSVPSGLAARPLVFLYRASDLERVTALRRLYPGGEARILRQSYPGRDFGVYLVR